MSNLEVMASFLVDIQDREACGVSCVAFFLPGADAGLFPDGAADGNPRYPGQGGSAGLPGNPLPEGQQWWR